MEKRIIVVDDDKEIREIVHFALTRTGFDVEVAANGQQLLELLRGSRPDLILLDVMMPGQNGYQLCYLLRSDPRTNTIPIIIMTAHVESIYERISVDVGAADHVTKPFHPLELVDKIREVLQRT